MVSELCPTGRCCACSFAYVEYLCMHNELWLSSFKAAVSFE